MSERWWKAGSDGHVALWDAVNDYAVACGGTPSQYVYGNARRMDAVVDVEKAVVQLAGEAEPSVAELRRVIAAALQEAHANGVAQ